MSDEQWQWHSQNGQRLTLRAIQADDRRRYAAFVAGLSYGARYFRYGNGNPSFNEEDWELVCSIDPAEGRRFVVVTSGNGEDVMVGTGGYFKETDGVTCVMTIVVADAWQGTQIAHRLMKTLIERATADRFKCMTAYVLATNRKMLRFTQRHGFGPLPGHSQEALKALCLCLDGGVCQRQSD
jgi:acetyltransferase